MGRSSGSSSSSSSSSTAARQAAARQAAFSGNTGGPAPGTGLTTGKTMYGNTAFGPAGGNAVGYATRSPGSVPSANQGTGLAAGSFSNFRDTSGAPMFSGGLQSRPVQARNAVQALGMLQALQAAQGAPKPAGGGAPGLLDPADEFAREVPSIPPNLSFRYNNVLSPGMSYANYFRNPTSFPQFASGWGQGYFGPPQSNASAAMSSMFMRNPTAFPQGATGWRQGYGGYRINDAMPQPTGEETIIR